MFGYLMVELFGFLLLCQTINSWNLYLIKIFTLFLWCKQICVNYPIWEELHHKLTKLFIPHHCIVFRGFLTERKLSAVSRNCIWNFTVKLMYRMQYNVNKKYLCFFYEAHPMSLGSLVYFHFLCFLYPCLWVQSWIHDTYSP